MFLSNSIYIIFLFCCYNQVHSLKVLFTSVTWESSCAYDKSGQVVLASRDQLLRLGILLYPCNEFSCTEFVFDQTLFCWMCPYFSFCRWIFLLHPSPIVHAFTNEVHVWFFKSQMTFKLFDFPKFNKDMFYVVFLYVLLLHFMFVILLLKRYDLNNYQNIYSVYRRSMPKGLWLINDFAF